jgi:hypothetical protein
VLQDISNIGEWHIIKLQRPIWARLQGRPASVRHSHAQGTQGKRTTLLLHTCCEFQPSFCPQGCGVKSSLLQRMNEASSGPIEYWLNFLKRYMQHASKMQDTQLVFFACFFCRHVKKTCNYPTQLSHCPITVKWLGRCELGLLAGAVWPIWPGREGKGGYLYVDNHVRMCQRKRRGNVRKRVRT